MFPTILYSMSPTDESDKYEEFKLDKRQHMELILTYYDAINSRSINSQKEMNQLKYLLELKDQKQYQIYKRKITKNNVT